MKRFIYNVIVILCLQSPLMLSQLQTDRSYSSSAGAALRMGFGARGIALGNTVASLIDSAVSSYYNPALLPYQQRTGFVASYGFLSLDRALNACSYSMHVKPNAGFSLFVLNTGVSNIDGRNINGYHTGMLSTSENVFGFSFGVLPSSKVSIGLSAKVYYYSLYEMVKSTTVGFDIGALYKVSDVFTVAIVVHDINSKYKWDTSQLYGEQGKSTIDRFPLRRLLSCTYSISYLSGLLAAEYEMIGKASLFRFGFETTPVSSFSFRLGIDEVMLDRSYAPKPSFGFSFRTQVFTVVTDLQYAYCIERYSPRNYHIITLALEFL